MLTDLVVRNLALIKDLTLEFDDGFTVLTGETGAGKTMLTGAVSLLAGGRSDPGLIGAGAEKAEVEGRFERPDGGELLIRREFSRSGRSRVFVDGHLSSLGSLAEIAEGIVDICGQRRHQSLLRRSARLAALDGFGGVDDIALAGLRARRRGLAKRLDALGTHGRARARELEVLEFQLNELDGAALDDPDEEQALESLERNLANAAELREAAGRGAYLLGSDGQVSESLSEAYAALAEVGHLGGFAERVADLQAAAVELAADLREKVEETPDDPLRLAEVSERRAVLSGLRRKYGETLADVIDFQGEARRRYEELQGVDEVRAALEAELEEVGIAERAEAALVGAQRRGAAPALAGRVSDELRLLAMPNARLTLQVAEEDPAEDVEFLLSVNSGSPPAPLAKVASGGELSRTMLALYVVLLQGPPTVVLDEVDAGVGGEAAVWVGRALARLATRRQILVVTHLPQVAAYADAHVAVGKVDDGQLSRVVAQRLDESARRVELARMLSGSPESSSALSHAAELLARAASERERPVEAHGDV